MVDFVDGRWSLRDGNYAGERTFGRLLDLYTNPYVRYRTPEVKFALGAVVVGVLRRADVGRLPPASGQGARSRREASHRGGRRLEGTVLLEEKEAGSSTRSPSRTASR